MWQLVPMEKNSSVPPYLLQSSISQERVGAGRCYTREISCWGDLTWHVEETSEALKEAPSIFSQDNSTAWESQWIFFFSPSGIAEFNQSLFQCSQLLETGIFCSTVQIGQGKLTFNNCSFSLKSIVPACASEQGRLKQPQKHCS